MFCLKKSPAVLCVSLLTVAIGAYAQTYDLADYFPVAHDSEWYLIDAVPLPDGDTDAFRWKVLDPEVSLPPGGTAVQFETTTDEPDDDRNNDRDFWQHSATRDVELWGAYINKMPSGLPKEIILSNPLIAGGNGMMVGETVTSEEDFTISTPFGPTVATLVLETTLTEALANVDTPMGRFDDVIRLRMTFEATGLPIIGTYQVFDNYVWLARDIGVVRQTQKADTTDATDQVLHSAVVGGTIVTAPGGTHVVQFQSEANGSISGEAIQIIANEGSGTEVAAVPDAGYRFVQWNADGALFSSDNPLTVANVTEDLILIAQFQEDTAISYTVTFAAGTGGSLTGETTQTVETGGSTSAVTAVPDTDYSFLRWTRYGTTFSTDNPLVIPSVTADMDLTAHFILSSNLLLAVRGLPDCAYVGDVVPVVIATDHSTVKRADITAFSVVETIPEGWRYYSVENADDLDQQPQVGDTGELTFVWSTPPTMPYMFIYNILPPTASQRVRSIDCFDGKVIYEMDGAPIELPIGEDVCMEFPCPCTPHMADQDGDYQIQLAPELTRLIQFYNSGGYHCAADTEDGYAPGLPSDDPADTAFGPHQADQNGDWMIEISPELTRLIQFYTSGGYHCQPHTEDGYEPGLLLRGKTQTSPHD